MGSRVIHWDGSDIPPELRKLPPGRYVVEPFDEITDLTPEDEEEILVALGQLGVGRSILLTDGHFCSWEDSQSDR